MHDGTLHHCGRDIGARGSDAHDAYAIADAMWRGIRAHPAVIPLVLTRRRLSATGFAAADSLIAALDRAGLADRDRLAAFHAVLGFVVGAAQAELAGPLTHGHDAAEAAAHIGSVAGATYPHIEALSKVAMKMSVDEDFDRGLPMLLDGIATRRSGRAAPPGRGSRRPSSRRV